MISITHDNTSGWLAPALALIAAGWSLIETPLELGVSASDAASLALALSKLVVVVAALAVMVGMRFARTAFGILCGASVWTVALALPMEYATSALCGAVSTIECVLKAAYILTLGWSSLTHKG